MKAKFKTKEKPDNTRPQIWYQPGVGSDNLFEADRVRILYPNGDAEMAIMAHKGLHDWVFKIRPCWLSDVNNKPIFPKGIEASRRLMNEFDKTEGFPKAVFVGNL